jgi:hypothetical protein
MYEMIGFDCQILHDYCESVILRPWIRQTNRIYVHGNHRASKEITELLVPYEPFEFVP